MQIAKIRLIGFKSFVEPVDLSIEPGLTGVVGPNGCGKSNLLEALRWVMGESSYKSMRATAMDDVIFSGTSARPPRNMAEVTIFIDNSDHGAPAEFNEADQIEVTRRIEREAGSAYRINGREVRARDVKILFEDAATGARSPALVRQGQIGEIVNAKPEQRRRILEDAAGIAGLHSRRHEAELRLKAAENNLTRIGDVTGQLKSQIDGLKRQARQAKRYTQLSDEIRRADALVHYLMWHEAQVHVDHDEAALQLALEALAVATLGEADAVKCEHSCAEAVKPLREAEVSAAATVARLKNEQASLDQELDRVVEREKELAAQVDQLSSDLQRETGLVMEAQAVLAEQDQALEETDSGLAQMEGRRPELATALESAERELNIAEQNLAQAMVEQTRWKSDRRAAEAQVEERHSGAKRLEAHLFETKKQISHLARTRPDPGERDRIIERVAGLRVAIEQQEKELAEVEGSIGDMRQRSNTAQRRRETSALAMNQADAERQTLLKLLVHNSEAAAVVDQVIVDSGYEAALGAALGDDLDAPVGNETVVHWRDWRDWEDGAAAEFHFPDGVTLLADVVKAPPALMKRLTMIGLVDWRRGASLQAFLRPGQRLVSTRGDMWRWDGFVVPAGAPSAAAQRLSARNRLRELDGSLPDLERTHAQAEAAVQELDRDFTVATERQQDLRRQLRELRHEREAAQGHLAEIESLVREAQTRLDVLQDRQAAVERELEAAKISLVAAQTGLAEIEQQHGFDAEVVDKQAAVVTARESAIAARSRSDALARDCQRLVERSEQITAVIAQWKVRAELATKQVEALKDRLTVARGSHAQTIAAPKKIQKQREELQSALDVAQARHRDATDKVIEAETSHKEAAQRLRAVQIQVGEQRETRARADARLEAARSRRADIVRKIQEGFGAAPEGCLVQAGYNAEVDLPALHESEGRLQRLKTDRERLGGVNLNAGEELERFHSQYEALESDRADIEAAITKLRGGIASLNRDGRKRLKEAFETVNAHFQDLFTTLFGGGEARLEMIEDPADPLAGGLEILAKPPGKKPTTLSLLSGGEQSLTALALIFAVFLTNPSPICVLDEVDAPLDDANVDRFCTLMEKMARNTATRFLVITHHPMTMARVDRLFGVTMAERGVSQLVSVDLSVAEELLESA